MKRNIFKLSILLVMCGFALVSCAKKEGKGSPEDEVVTATVKYSMPDRYDLAKYFDMTAYYTNNEGKEVSEVITTPTWEKTLTKVPVPGVYQLKVVYTRNSTALAQDSYKIGRGLAISSLTSAGQRQDHSFSNKITVSQEHIEEYLALITDDVVSVDIEK